MAIATCVRNDPTVESIPSTTTIPGLKLKENLEVRCCPFLSVEFYE